MNGLFVIGAIAAYVLLLCLLAAPVENTVRGRAIADRVIEWILR